MVDTNHLLRRVFEEIFQNQIFGTPLFANGSESSPGFGFVGSSTSGLYANTTPSNNRLGVAVRGSEVFEFEGTSATSGTTGGSEAGFLNVTIGDTEKNIKLFDTG